MEGQHAAGEPRFASLLHTKVFKEIRDHRVGDLLGVWEVRSQYAEKLMIVLQPYA